MSMGSIRTDGVAGQSLNTKKMLQKMKTMHKQTKDEYLNTIIRPLEVTANCRIPDHTSYPSATFSDQLESTLQVRADATGSHGFIVVFTPGGITVYTESAASTAGVIAYDNAVNQRAFGGAAVVAGYRLSRLVGAGINVDFIGTDSTNGGLIHVAYLNSGDFRVNNTISYYTSLNAIAESRLNYNGPLKNGFKGHYLPLDPYDFIYRAPYNATSNNFTQVYPEDYLPICAFQVTVSANSTVNLRLNAVGHYEGLTISDVGIVGDLGDIVNDNTALEYGMNNARMVPFMDTSIGAMDIIAVAPTQKQVRSKSVIAASKEKAIEKRMAIMADLAERRYASAGRIQRAYKKVVQRRRKK